MTLRMNEEAESAVALLDEPVLVLCEASEGAAEADKSGTGTSWADWTSTGPAIVLDARDEDEEEEEEEEEDDDFFDDEEEEEDDLDDDMEEDDFEEEEFEEDEDEEEEDDDDEI